MIYNIISPIGKEDFDKYYYFRWEYLRKPLDQKLGTEQDKIEDKRTYKTHKEWASDMSFENNGGLVVDDTGECDSCQ